MSIQKNRPDVIRVCFFVSLNSSIALFHFINAGFPVILGIPILTDWKSSSMHA